MKKIALKTVCAAAFELCLLLPLSEAARADEIRVMISGTFAAPYMDLVPEFERRTSTRDRILGGRLGQLAQSRIGATTHRISIVARCAPINPQI